MAVGDELELWALEPEDSESAVASALGSPELPESPPVVVDVAQCIQGCRVCIESCPVDCLSISPETGKAHMEHDECWYCLACEIDCPKDAITVKIPFLLR